MNDRLVSDLREAARFEDEYPATAELHTDAADEIERLRALLREARDNLVVEDHVYPLLARIDAALTREVGMSETKHTPGPWDVDEGDFSIYRLETGEQLAEMFGHQTPDEVEANARLMASAPDMLDEIERLRAELAAERERLADTTDSVVVLIKERDALRALLREARKLMTYVMTFDERAQMCVRIDAALKGDGE